MKSLGLSESGLIFFKALMLSMAFYRMVSITFDESGFAMKISATTKAVAKRGVLQLGNREWVTMI